MLNENLATPLVNVDRQILGEDSTDNLNVGWMANKVANTAGGYGLAVATCISNIYVQVAIVQHLRRYTRCFDQHQYLI